MKKLTLAICIGAAFLSQSALASTETTPNRAISYLTSWGLSDGDAARMENSKVDTLLLSFGQWKEDGSIETSDNIATPPAYDPWWLPPAYNTWTQLKLAKPEKKMMVAFGGQTYERIWSMIDTPEKRDVIAQGLATLLKTPYPVYKKNLKPSEMQGECLNYNWNHTVCDMSTYQKAGEVYLDGIDFDFEKAARLTEKENSDLLALAQKVRELIGKEKVLSLTTYHVGADPESCNDPAVFENCSFVDSKRSAHNGEVLPLLKGGKNIFDFFNVMAYDAGKDFRYKVAMNNYAKAVGDASKVVLGTTINMQWDPVQNFVESKENNIERARWQAAEGYGGFFTWAFGASSQVPPLSLTQQIDYVNEMKDAAIKAEEAGPEEGIKISAVIIDNKSIEVMMPQSVYKGKNRIVVELNGKYIGESYNGTRYYSYRPSALDGLDGMKFKKTIKKGDKITVNLREGTPGSRTYKVIKNLYSIVY